jgi:hypothetical protein
MKSGLLNGPNKVSAFPNVKRSMGVALTIAFISQLAFASTATEVSRFLKIYRVGEMQRISLESMINGAVKDKRITKENADCILKDLAPKKLGISARPVVEEHFTDEKTLKAINDFFATKLGQRILDAGSKAQASAMKDIAAGREPAPMPNMAMSQDEIKNMDVWEKSQAYSAFKSFVAEKLPKLEAIGNNDLKMSIGACQAKDNRHA